MADTRLQMLEKIGGQRNPAENTEYQNLLAAQGGGGGGSDFSQIPSVSSYVESQFASENTALQDLVTQMMGREKPLDIYGRLETEAGLPELRGVSTSLSKEIGAIEDYLDQIEPDVSARTRESLVTEAQRRGMVAAGREPFLQKLGKFGTALGRIGGRISEAERGIGTKVGLAMQGQEMELQPLELRYKTLIDRNVRLTSGFMADRQTQLDFLFDKFQRERQLSDMELQQANQLAQEERQYFQGLKASAADLGIQISGYESGDAILNAIAVARAEQVSYERAQKAKTSGGINFGGGTPTFTPTETKPTNRPSLDYFWSPDIIRESGGSATLR